ncbi:RNA polymerase sigma factor [Steroidobacter sp.]|uniref:RNA polymerase sigma factor n=1 Tax=Steroidobacter sp. TaxID=1978227 RepID=UPI0025D83BE0|nr:RNA polymerase sigma factor [Steroidobacter sp.]
MVDIQTVEEWFVREVLPLEASLLRFLRRNGIQGADPSDLRQEVYARVFESALSGLPVQARAFVFTAARNLLIDYVRRTHVVTLSAILDMDSAPLAIDHITPERQLSAREELSRFQAGLQRLPARCRQVVEMRKILGLSQREVASRLGIGEDTVERQTLLGMRALADYMLGGSGRIRRPPAQIADEAT